MYLCRCSVITFAFVLLTASACLRADNDSITSVKNSLPRDGAVTQSVFAQKWMSAIANDDVAELKELLRLSKSDQLMQVSAVNGKNALMVASKQGDLGLAKQLVKRGLNINDMTETNGTAFMFAVLGDSRKVGEWLISGGADIDVVGSNGWTALTIASAKGNLPMLRWLVTLGADAQVRDVYRYTPFLRAVDNGHTDVVRYLLTLKNTDVNARDEYDNTALHHAALAGEVAMLETLLEAKANPLIRNRAGQLARELIGDNEAVKGLFEQR